MVEREVKRLAEEIYDDFGEVMRSVALVILEKAAQIAEEKHRLTGVIDGGRCGEDIAADIRALKDTL